jgi:hypothetical protein
MIEELYPEALRHLRSAYDSKKRMGRLWAAVLEANPLASHVTVTPDGEGTVRVSIEWPDESREMLTSAFAELLDELWRSLDSLIEETVAMFSVLHTPRHEGSRRYFPVADSAEGFEALLAQGCMDGILNDHYEMVRITQPWMSDVGIEIPDRLRAGLRKLISWSSAVEEGVQITAWATPHEPRVRVWLFEMKDGVTLSAPSEILYDGTIVGTFNIPNYDGAANISADPGSYIDLGFAGSPAEATTDDSFATTVDEVMEVVLLFAAYFADWSAAVDLPRNILRATDAASDIWVEATSTNRGWEEGHLQALRDSETGVGVIVDDSESDLTIVVSTPTGVFERRVPSASALRKAATVGVAAEGATRDAVATWGLPDFVMRPRVETKGSGVREISDGILVVGDRGAVLQVKGRNAEPRDDDKERRWILKSVLAACRQVNGTVRRLRAGPTTMENGRGREIEIDGAAIDWLGVVVIEHGAPPGDLDVSFARANVPTVVLLRRDWEFLFDQLKSTRAVLDYLARVGSSVELGEEPFRYFELANLDAVAPAIPNPLFEGLGSAQSIPLLPEEPAGHNNPRAFQMVRRMCEEIAGVSERAMSEEMRLQILADIDGLHVGSRESLGSLLLEELDLISTNPPEGIRWKFRTFLSPRPGGTQIGFGVCSVLNENVQNAFNAWVQLRHYERREREDLTDARSIGVMLTPRPDGKRDWDTSLFVISGDLNLTKKEYARFTKLWGRRGDRKYAV